MNYILFDGAEREHLLPLTFTRPVAEIRIGITTLKEKWECALNTHCSYLTTNNLAIKYPTIESAENILINSAYIPNNHIVTKIKQLKKQQAIVQEDNLIAVYAKPKQVIDLKDFEIINFEDDIIHIKRPHHIFQYNKIVLESDFQILTKGRISQPIPKGTLALNEENIFIEEGAQLLFSTLNAIEGPIYIGRHAIIQEGAHLRGPIAIGDNAQVNMGARIYGATTIGPVCKVGGEISNSVLFSYSSKGHEGFMGNSVLGEWCNWGADTNNSNLKNDYTNVKLWNYATERFEKTELQFCGLIMGDHSKTAINTQFNTGTVVGICCNVYQSGFPKNIIPDFTWGMNEIYQLTKAKDVAQRVLARRGKNFTSIDAQILDAVFEETKALRQKLFK